MLLPLRRLSAALAVQADLVALALQGLMRLPFLLPAAPMEPMEHQAQMAQFWGQRAPPATMA